MEGTMSIFISFLVAIIVAQLLKLFFRKDFTWKFFMEFGGMPSAHVAGVIAMMVSLYFVEGFSALFFIALIFSLIVMRDALGVRAAVSLNSKAINSILKNKKLKEDTGHTLYEVIAGFILGIFIGILVMVL